MGNSFEFEMKNDYFEFIEDKPCIYRLIVLCETSEEELYVLLNKQEYSCIYGNITNAATIKELCCYQIKDHTDIVLDPNDIKFWKVEDEQEFPHVILNYVVCIQGKVDDRWINIKELKDLPIKPEDLDIIENLYKYVTKKKLFE